MGEKKVTDEERHRNEAAAVPRRAALRACTLMVAGLVSMTAVAVGHRTGVLDRFRAWVAEVPELGALAQSAAKSEDRSL